LAIRVEHVTKQFAGKRNVIALDDVSLAIERGEMVSVVGPSGSGKSTLLNLLGGLDRPTSGRVRIDGRFLDGLSDDQLTLLRRETIGFVFQFFHLLPTLNCLENVALPLHLRGWRRRRVEERALAANPVVILADEPTGNLDSLTGDEILSLIRDLHARLGSTVVVVTHDARVAGSCGRTISLRDGRVVDDVRR
jgi:putative ABC transport system ATP-binding protein